jgi:hypothetical protein
VHPERTQLVGQPNFERLVDAGAAARVRSVITRAPTPQPAKLPCVDVVGFELRSGTDLPYPIVAIKVNGRDLAELIGEIERPLLEREGRSPDIAGSYRGYTSAQLGEPVPAHFLGSSQSHLECGPRDKTALLDCECGSPGCWTLMARVTITDETVTWSDFEQVHRQWDYGGFTLTFDRAQFDTALAKVGPLR